MPQLKQDNPNRPRPASARDVVAAANTGDQIFLFHKEHGRLPSKAEIAFYSIHRRFPAVQELNSPSAH